MLLHSLRRMWRLLPIRLHRRQQIQRLLFRLLPWVFAGHPAFPAVQRSRREAAEARAGAPAPSPDAMPVALHEGPPLADPPVRLVAFYLPQFHPIPENDAWWGRGFTEWTNVVRGTPQFPGHYQPRLPGELGFYDLRVPAVLARQVELARLYGIGGFAFYFYWFGGKRLLEGPLLAYLERAELDLPFCLCWANESWTRRWDGREREVLIAQAHSPEDDLAFIAYVAKYFRDPRYIRVAGRPLLVLYRPDLLPEPSRTALRWRTWCRENGIGEILLAATHSFDSENPARYGLDASIEFPPNNSHAPDITRSIPDLAPDFRGAVYDWRVFPERSRRWDTPGWMLFRGVNPGWDNVARRRSAGAVFIGASPAGYREWLENAVADTQARFADPSARLVFVNAWNEWAEGAHLEPDARLGYAYLQATRDALEACRDGARRPLLVVGHDAEPHGAQQLALNIVREAAGTWGRRVRVVLLGGGSLSGDFARVPGVQLADASGADRDALAALAKSLHDAGIRDAIVNSTASGALVPHLEAAGIRTLVLVHELPALIRNHGLAQHAQRIAAHGSRIVFPARTVRSGFETFAPVPAERAIIRPQGLYKRNRLAGDRAQARAELRQRLQLAETDRIVLGMGYGNRRKGFDLFVESAAVVGAAREDVVFVWAGDIDRELADWARGRTAEGTAGRLLLPGYVSDTDPFYAGSDLFALTSREDPFPSVVLEAFEVGLPVLAFAGTGGAAELADCAGLRLVSPLDAHAYAQATLAWLGDPAGLDAASAAARAPIQRDYGFSRYVADLLAFTGDPPPRVSVVVPNYNYYRYLPERLGSIAAQTHPIYELIVLDDASRDGSREWLARELTKRFPEAQLVLSDSNSGSVFAQWLKGAELARGEILWIAEADDLAEPGFLAEALRALADPAVVLSYTQSQQIAANGSVLCPDYLDYVSDLSRPRWESAYTADGSEEIALALAVKNTIPNVSAVLMRTEPLREVLRQHIDCLKPYRVAGDWLVYSELLKRGRIGFSPQALNLHRRHAAGATLSRLDIEQLKEILSVQKRIRDAHPLPPETVARALAYARSLYAELGIATRRFPRLEDHPLLAEFLPS